MSEPQARDWHPQAEIRNVNAKSSTNGNGNGSSNTSSTNFKYDYAVDDVTPDLSVAPDAWAEYLRTRYSKRKRYYQGLEQSEQELIRKEVRRIRYFREHFKDYRAAPTDRLPLVALLDDSRTKWRDLAQRRAPDELTTAQKRMDRDGVSTGMLRNRAILNQVQQWRSMDYQAARDSMAPDAYMPDLESGPDYSEDDPRKADYGYNGWAIAYERGQGPISLDHPLVHGSFPHQKISIQQFLYNKQDTPLKRDNNKDRLRYFHLPANNMLWVEEAISRYYGEDNIEFDGKRVLTLKHNAQRLLRNEVWRGQQRGGVNLPAHSRQIGTRCSFVPSAPLGSPADEGLPRKDIALFMPYLHWEVEKRLQRMGQFVQVAKSRKLHSDRLRRATTNRFKGRLANVARDQGLKPILTGLDKEESRNAGHSWRPTNPLAKYLWHVAKLFQIIDEAADGRLIEDHLYSSAPLHMRRTLEQFYYWTAEDTSRRDRDQVVCRATRFKGDDPDHEAVSRIVMVDQLWLWILDDNTVISAFPRRWGRNKPDPSAVHRGIRDRLGSLDSDQIDSVYDLALVIIDECSKVFFDHTKPLDQRPDVVDLFSSAISTIAENKTIAYEGFGRDVTKISLDTLESAEKLLRKSLNIGFEWSILEEAQQVIDELQIMQEIFSQQMTVMKTLARILQGICGDESKPPANDLQASRRKAMERISAMITDMEQRRGELEGMEKLQTKTRQQLRELLDMKQQQSNIIEAKAAIRRADETVLQGRSIVVFTVVTIFFLPLSFLSSVFGMNAPELSSDGLMPLNKQLMYMFGISAGIIVLSLALAFSTWVRTVLSVGFGLVYTAVEDWLGWRHRKANYSSTAIKNIHLQKLRQLESRDHARRLTEIDSRRLTSPSRRPEMKHRSTWDLRHLTEAGPWARLRGRKRGNKAAETV